MTSSLSLPDFGVLPLFALACAGFLAVGAALAFPLTLWVRRSISRWSPRARHRVLVLLSATPALFAALFLIASSLPSVAALFAPSLDHCEAHGDGHAHLCFRHIPHDVGTWWFIALFLIAAVVTTGFALRSLRDAQALRILKSLESTGERREDLGVTILDVNQPLCVAAGLRSPSILMSRGLFEGLTSVERDIVVAHESAHVRRRDALVSYVAGLFAALHWPSHRDWIRSELELAAEQACDEEAAQCAPDRLAVAATILAVERVMHSDALEPLWVPAFASRHVERRVEALLAEPTTESPPIHWLLGAAALLILAAADPLHHATETLLSFLAR